MKMITKTIFLILVFLEYIIKRFNIDFIIKIILIMNEIITYIIIL